MCRKDCIGLINTFLSSQHIVNEMRHWEPEPRKSISRKCFPKFVQILVTLLDQFCQYQGTKRLVEGAKVEQATWSTLPLETWYPNYVKSSLKLALSIVSNKTRYTVNKWHDIKCFKTTHFSQKFRLVQSDFQHIKHVNLKILSRRV